MGVSFLGQGLSMAIGGTIAYLVSWRGVFASYAGLSVIANALLLGIGSRIPSQHNPRSKVFAPFAALLTKRASVMIYMVVLLEGILIIGSFSYLGTYIAHNYHFDNLVIGLIMTAFGALAVIGGRASGRLAARLGRRSVLTAGLLLACAADALVFFPGGTLPALIARVGLLGIGFMLAHSTLLTVATEFAAKERGMAMSLAGIRFDGRGRHRDSPWRPTDQRRRLLPAVRRLRAGSRSAGGFCPRCCP